MSRKGSKSSHGLNMAFDHQTQRLADIYDFDDAGFGELHEEFIYTTFISPKLTLAVIKHYKQKTGRLIDQNRVSILTGTLLLTELANMSDDPEHGATCLNNATT